MRCWIQGGGIQLILEWSNEKMCRFACAKSRNPSKEDANAKTDKKNIGN